MKIIKILLLFIILLELVLLFYYLINRKTKRENKMFLIFCIIIIIFLILYLKGNMFNKLINIKYLFLLLIAIFSSIILKLIFNNFILEDKYNNIKKCVLEYEKIIDEQGKKNHEYNNQLMILKGYINNKKKLNEYLDTMIIDQKTGQNYEIRQLSNFSNDGLKEMLYYKISKIKNNNIKYYLYVSKEISKSLEKLNINFYKDITKVFGVLIDNAIEASLDSKEKEVGLDFSSEDNQIIVTISNTYNKNIDFNKVGRKGFSSKGKGHGFGLKLVKDIIKRNKNLELITDYDNKYFIQTIIIYL